MCDESGSLLKKFEEQSGEDKTVLWMPSHIKTPWLQVPDLLYLARKNMNKLLHYIEYLLLSQIKKKCYATCVPFILCKETSKYFCDKKITAVLKIFFICKFLSSGLVLLET